MMQKLSLLLVTCVVARVAADKIPIPHQVGHYAAPGHHGALAYPAALPHYAFNYAVHDDYAGTHFGHSEARDGYKTEGKYFVHLPDGRIQTVTYVADKTGYHPIVSYEGSAQYNAHRVVTHHAPTPVYHAPVVPAYHV